MQYPRTLRSKRKMHQRYKKFQSGNAQIFGYVYQSANGPNHGPVWKIQSFLSSEICMVILRQDFYGKGNLRMFYWNTVGKKFQTGYEDCSYQCMWTRSNWQANQKNLEPTWKILMEEVDLGEPTSFLDHENLGCTQRECTLSNDIVANYRCTFDSRIITGAKENYLQELQGNLMQKQYLLGPMTWKVTQINVWTDFANFRKKDSTIRQSHAEMCGKILRSCK